MKKIASIIGITILLTTIAISGCTEQKKPEIHSFEAVPNEITLGKTANLKWNVTDATTISINNGIGTVPLSGNRTVSPTVTTTYILTAISSTTITATTTLVVNEANETPNISMSQSLFYIEITQTNNARVPKSEVIVVTLDINTSENQTSILKPVITEGDGNPTFLGSGDIISFQNLSDFPVGTVWDVQLMYRGERIGQCSFKNPKGPYDTPIVRMIQFESNVSIIGILNGPIDQTKCSITAINATSGTDQAIQIGAAVTDKDNNPSQLGISDQITFRNLGAFKARDSWMIQLSYNGEIISECNFIKPVGIILIPTG